MSMRAPAQQIGAAVTRLAALSPLDAPAQAALALAVRRPRSFRAHREIVAEGKEITETLLVLSGWAARVRLLVDGRRQIISFLLPGDLIGWCDQERPVASSAVIAITDVDVCTAPDAAVSPALARAYAHSRARDEAYLLAQITRLGRLAAQERIADLVLELMERLELAGLAANGRYVLPITQEVMADALGLTSVHVNRTLQTLRREGLLNLKGRELIITDPTVLARTTGHRPVRISAASSPS